MKLSTFYDHILQAREQTGKPVEELLSLLKSYGVCGLEIHYSDLLRDKDFLLPVLEKYDLALSGVYETYDFVGKPDVSLAYGLVDLAAAVHAGQVLVIPGFLSSDEQEPLHALHNSREKTFSYMEASASIQNIRKRLTDLVNYAKPKHVHVTLEDFDANEAPYSRIYQLLYFMEQVDGLKYTFDMGNFAYADEDASLALETLAPYLVHVHCKDRGVEDKYISVAQNDTQPLYVHCRGLACVPMGGGYLPIDGLVRRLQETGYNGYYVIEHFDAPDQMAYLKQSARFLHALGNN